MVELLAPAGNFEKLKFAFEYGADAAYLGFKKFSLRNLSGNFTLEELKQARDLADKLNKKIYLTLNIYPYEEDIDEILRFLDNKGEFKPHAFIVSDPGIITLVKNFMPDVPIHLSTQANTTNSLTVNFWHNIGIKRLNLARELSLRDIKNIRKKNNSVELEIFIHGAMCMSLSGRCLFSNFLTTRPSNKGECTHPCRWKYFITEETREGEYFEVFEDNRGTYLFNSKDLCGIYYLPELIEAGINSLKIEGRMKSIYYLANVLRVYREAINSFYDNPEKFKIKNKWIDELNSVSNRGYTKGFFEKRNNLNMENFESSGYIRNYQFMGIIKEKKEDKLIIESRNKIFKNENLEIITKNFENFNIILDEIFDVTGEPLDFVQPMNIFYIKTDTNKIPVYSILRKKIA
jgi:putative protease